MPHPSFWILPAAGLCISIVLHVITLWIFPRWKLLDFPERYGHSRPPIPYPTGIVAIISFVILFLYYEQMTLQATGVVASCILLGLCCFIDDRHTLPTWLRLGIQICIAIVVFATGTHIFSLTNPLDALPGFSEVIALDRLTFAVPHLGSLPIISGIFTVGWLLLTTNALNWFDGIPGQVSTMSTLGFITLGCLSLSGRVNQPELAIIAFLLAGIALGSSLFDVPKQRVLMGDTGAMFFGFMLGVLTIYAGGKVATAFLVLGVPLFDSMIVIIRRILRGKSPMQGNTHDEHLHHRLLRKGWSRHQIILLTAGLGASFGISALFMSTLEKFIAAVVLLLIMLALSWYSRSPKK